MNSLVCAVALFTQPKLCWLFEAIIHLAWVEDENAREHQQCEQALSFISIRETLRGLLRIITLEFENLQKRKKEKKKVRNNNPRV